MPETALQRRPIGLAIFLIVAGVVGWVASFTLTLEKIEILINPSYVPSCNISVLVSCGPNMASAQGSLFGFPNPIIGVACFVAVIVVGVGILAGARFAKWFWVLFNVGIALALVFVIWLISVSIFVLGTLCPYCMVVWVTVIPLFWYVTAYNLKEGHIPVPVAVRNVVALFYPFIWMLVILSYLVIAVLAQLRLDAIASLTNS
ncbi:vitamin K epoxide reductase family protein [Subtercola sp. RTI3]|uniref:vitamin K epoxide reductase family protein n=1 Tax=Subtercola sp. RTI3 TaxID=3048639 RepID=UPI002B22351F|nr:vitamin K epoxide reductase family protein [Subtercola sp. RTI3]MEA9986859.1 vitamin K epoxide reductase family protein [Subtercola sp. RTI3]